MSDKPFRDIVRVASAKHPIPFVLAIVLSFSLACFGLSALLPPPLAYIVAGAGVLGTLAGIGWTSYAFVYHRDLLRSETHILATRAFEILLDKAASATAHDRAGRIIEGVLLADLRGRKTAKNQAPTSLPRGAEDGDG